MNLKKYDNKCVVIEDYKNDKFEGVCYYYSKEYNEHEYGVYEDSLVMSHVLFYESSIRKVEIIQEFSGDYGKLEEILFESGMDIIEEVLEGEEEKSIYRLLLYLENRISTFSKEEKERLIKSLETIIKYNEDAKIIDKANQILKLKL